MFSRTWALDGLEGLGLPLSKVQVCVPLGPGLLIPGPGLPAPGPGLVCLPSSLGPGLSPSRYRPKSFGFGSVQILGIFTLCFELQV